MQYCEKLFDNRKKLLYAWFSAMFTRIDIMLLTDNSGDDLKLLAEKIKSEIEKFEIITNRFDENSEISRINKTAYANSCKISAELYLMVDECLIYNTKTLGYFDITVNSINGFTKGISNIQLNKSNQTIRFLHPDLKLDLSGFVKGFVLRTIRSLLQEGKINNALINIGNSSILAVGNHPHGSGWKISIPELSSNDCVLHDECLTTSGNTKNTKWPIQNPQTRERIERSQTISVVTDDPATGEVLSTSLYIANEDEKKIILTQLKGKIQNFN